MSRRPLAALATALLAALACNRAPAPAAPPPASPESGSAAPAPAAARPAPAPVVPRDGAPASFAELVGQVKGAVVNVEVRAGGRQRDVVFDTPFGPMRGPAQREPVRQGQGSGFIVRADGLVLTNHHVVADATAVTVKLDDGRSFPAKVLGRDPLTDVAVLQLEGGAKDLPTVALGDSDAVRVGDWVVAIGNPFGLASSVSAGILSARARDIRSGPYDDFLQTDAAINPGNSGGPLFDMGGRVVGMNTAIVGGGTGIGFAVPSNLMQALLPQLETKGRVTRGWLGVGVQELTAELSQGLGVGGGRTGALITQVNPGGPAAKGGLKPDDVVLSLDGKPIGSAGALTRTVALVEPGHEVALGVWRDGKELTVKVKLGTRPDYEGLGVRGREDAEEAAPHASASKLGLALADDPSGGGPLVVGVEPGSAAERAGLRPGLRVVEANRKPVESAADLADALQGAPDGRPVLLRVEPRQGGSRSLVALSPDA